MVNQAEQPESIDAPLPETGNTTTDITSEFEGVNTFDDTEAPVADAPEVETTGEEAPPAPAPEATPTEQTAVEEQTPAEQPVAEVNPEIDQLQRRLQSVEEQNQQYLQNQQQAQFQQQANQIRQQYEAQGYLPDQAQQLAQNWLTQTSSNYQQSQQHQQQIQYLQGQANAAEHFATKYDLKMSDLATLKQFDNPQAMEQAAKELQRVRGLEEENARLKAERVPSQTFDNSQSTPAASNDEDRLLERYNQGDRSHQAQAAARRAAGLG